MEFEHLFRDTFGGLLREVADGPPAGFAFVLNPGDHGLLGSLSRLSATEASARVAGRSSIAAHVEHLRYGLELMNRWSRGDNPFGDANFSAAWSMQTVSDDEWHARRAALEREVRAWQAAIAQPRQWEPVTLGGALGSVVHLAYHLGAIRQLSAAAAGPRAAD